MSTTKVQAVALGQRVSRGEARRAARRCAQRLGYTLCDIQEILQDADRGRSPCFG